MLHNSFTKKKRENKKKANNVTKRRVTKWKGWNKKKKVLPQIKKNYKIESKWLYLFNIPRNMIRLRGGDSVPKNFVSSATKKKTHKKWNNYVDQRIVFCLPFFLAPVGLKFVILVCAYSKGPVKYFSYRSISYFFFYFYSLIPVFLSDDGLFLYIFIMFRDKKKYCE